MPWPQDAYVGQEVVCVHMVGVRNSYCAQHKLVVNAVYRIKEIELIPEGLHITVSGPNATWSTAWHVRHFRPVQSTSRGMEILRGLLNTKPADELVEG